MRRDFFCLLVLLFIPFATSEQVDIYTLNNQTFRGTVARYTPSPQPMVLLDEGGQTREILCQDIIRIMCNEADTTSPTTTKVILNNGAVLYGKIVDGNPSYIRVSSDIGAFAVELTKIRRIVFDPERSISEKKSEDDVLFFRSGDMMTGIIERFGKGFVEIYHDQLGKRTVYFDKLAAIHFALLEPFQKSDEFIANIVGLDNSSISGSISQIAHNNIHFEVAYLDSQLLVPMSKIRYIFFKNGKFVYLSDLPSNQYKVDYISSFPRAYPQIRLDKNQRGGPLEIKGQKFYKGIGTIATVEITVLLRGEYKGFHSFIGIDDEVARISENNIYSMGGNVIFQVLLDGKKVYDSGVVNTSTPLKSIDIDVTGKEKMILVVKSAINGPYNDLANWAEALLLR